MMSVSRPDSYFLSEFNYLSFVNFNIIRKREGTVIDIAIFRLTII